MSLQTADIVIIMPLWRQPDFADEAISSVIALQDSAHVHLIIVNDGCPLPDTSIRLEAWAQAYPDKLTVLSQANQGLSAARNAGITLALNRSAARALFFLDADNRLDETAALTFNTHLESYPDADWFYPQFDMFGSGQQQANGGAWSLSRMAVTNICEAGSLVRRHVFEAGLRFDITFRQGYEDWDFWLGAAKAGFRGHAVAYNFFRYRRRQSSMSQSAHENFNQIVAHLHQKHSWLFRSGKLAQICAQEWPRFAEIIGDDTVRLGDGPAGTSMPTSEFISLWFGAELDGFSARIPNTLVFCSGPTRAFLHKLKRYESVLLQVESALRSTPVAALFLEEAPAVDIRAEMRFVDREAVRLQTAGLIAISRSYFIEALRAESLIDGINDLISKVRVTPLVLTSPKAERAGSFAIEAAITLLGQMKESKLTTAPLAEFKPWREPADVASPSKIWRHVANLNLGGLPLPGQGVTPKPKIGFILPIMRFGGVEKCVVALAEALNRQGVECQLFIYGTGGASAAEWMIEPFSMVHQLSRDDMLAYSDRSYMGTAGGRAPDRWISGDLFGPLTGLDAVINAGCAPLHHALQPLRRFGVKTALYEHLVNHTAWGRPNGSPYLALSYEGACDLVLTCSNQLADWLAGMGLARDKLLALSNGPGFPCASDRLAIDRATRVARGDDRPLRVGFMGRFDHQKGLDRFIEIATALHAENVAFSVTGAQVLDQDTTTIPDWIERHPLAHDPAEIAAAYARLDVLLMPSRSEGLPLAIREAQRAGVVAVVSNVGAVSEAIEHEVTGLLLPSDSVVSSAIDALRRLAKDRTLLRRMAATDMVANLWDEHAATLLRSFGIDPLA